MATQNPDDGKAGESAFESAKRLFGDTAAGFTEQASSRARDYAGQGKDRAVDALDNVAALVEDAANQVSEKLGDQYGGYIRQAADMVSSFANTLRDKDTDELIENARDVVRASPGVAIAAAAATGFLLTRVVKAGLTPQADNDQADSTPSTADARSETTAMKPSSQAAPEVPPEAASDTPRAPEMAVPVPPASDNPPAA